MKRVIKNTKKMKNTMYIVFGVFALALFLVTKINPSYAENGLNIDKALDNIVLYGEVDEILNNYENENDNQNIEDVEINPKIIEDNKETIEEVEDIGEIMEIVDDNVNLHQDDEDSADGKSYGNIENDPDLIDKEDYTDIENDGLDSGTGTDNTRTDNTRTDNTGIDNTRTDNTGIDNTGIDDTGISTDFLKKDIENELYMEIQGEQCNDGENYSAEISGCYTSRDENNIVYYGNDGEIGTITIKDPDGTQIITIMDKNLGATSNDINNQSSWGYYFQRGNNHQILESTETVTPSTNKPIYQNYWPGHQWNGTTEFIKSENELDYWSGFSYVGNNQIRHYGGLWGGYGDYWDTAENGGIWGGLKNGDLRQGPCPTGYHVPSAGERNALAAYYYNAKNPSAEKKVVTSLNSSFNESTFRTAFKLPLAGRRDSNSAVIQWTTYGFYLSSSPSSFHGNKPLRLKIDSQGIIPGDGNGYNGDAFSVRCFKDAEDAPSSTTALTVLFKLQIGEQQGTLLGATNNNGIQELKQYVVSGRWVEQPVNPSIEIEDVTFLGRTEDLNSSELFDFSQPVSSPITLYAKLSCREGYNLNSDGTACVRSVNVTYDANGGIFGNGNIQNVVAYEGSSQDTTLYSHTINISDDGVQSGSYPNNQSGSHTVIITGANKLHVTLKYGTESSWDYLYVFKGVYTGSVTKNMSAGQLYTYNGNSNSPVTTEFDIEGDTVTFSFYSDGSVQYYGYYAKIEGVMPYYINDEVEEPTREGYKFLGWYEDESIPESYDFTQPIYGNKTLYAIWGVDNGGENNTTATLLTGQNFNMKIKSIASIASGGNAITSYSTSDRLIKRIKRAYRIPTQVEPELISITGSEKPVYAWYDTGNSTLYYYSEAGIIYMNENSFYMFGNLQNLISIDISSFDTSKVTNMRSMFNKCNSLEILNLSNFDTSKVNDMSYMFYECKNLKELDVSSFDTSKVNDMSYMFYYCENLEYLNLNSFRTGNVRTMEGMFWFCKKIKTLNLNTFDASRVSTMKNMFRRCDNLEYLYMDINTRGVSDMSLMFAYCYSLRVLIIDSFDTSSVTDMNSMFLQCYSLTSLDLSHFNTKKVTNMGSMFNSCSSLEQLDISNFNTSNVTNMYGMFQGCTSLTSINLNSFDTSKVTNMGYMFSDCSSLTQLDLRGFDTHNVTNMANMFYNCSRLTELKLNNFDTRKVTSMYYMFYNCSSLIELDISSFDTQNVENMGYGFYNMSSLRKIYASYMFTTNKFGTDYLFNNSYYLVGQNGTTYNNNYRDKSYARIDKTGQPGYFTEKYVVNFDSRGGSLVKKQYVKYGDSVINPLQPDRDESIFLGWYISGTDTKYDFNSPVIGELFLYVKWDCVNEGYTDDGTKCEKNNSATFTRGEDFNKKIKSLVDSNLGLYDSESQIINIQRADSDEGVIEKVKVSAENSLNDIYAWFYSGTVYYYTTANVIYLNENSQYMFAYMNGIKSLDLSDFDTSLVTDMGNMFNGDSKLKSIYVSDKFNTDAVSDSTMFAGTTSIRGGKGTTYDSSIIGKRYARIDKSLVPGYFTDILDREYKIEYELNGGILSGKIDTYTSRDSFMITTPIKTGYNFLGWTGSNGMIPETKIQINNGTKGKLIFVANWELKPAEPNKSSGGGGGGGGGGGTQKSDDKSGDVHGSADETSVEVEEKGKTFIEREDNKLFPEENKNEIDKVGNKGISQDVSEYTQEQVDAYTFAKSNGITTTPTIEKAKMNTSLKRIEMAKMLSYYAINVLGQTPNAEKGTVKFNDVTDKMDKQYDNGVTLAYQLGIMGQNMKNNNFRPNDEVTRAEFATALSRLIYKTDEGKYKGTGRYYEPHMAVLYNEGVITNTDPNMKEKRGYVMLMLMRSMKK